MSKRLKLDEKKLVKLYHEHKSTVTVGKLLGCSDVTVANRLRSLGIPRTYAGNAGRDLKPRLELPERKIIRFYKRTQNALATAKRFHCSAPTIYSVLERYSVPKRSRFKYDGAEIIRLYGELGTAKAVADKLGCCYQTVSKHLKWQGQNIPRGCRCPGDKHYNWQGGRSKEPYPPGWTNALKEAIRQRDNRKCRLCARSEENNKTRLCVHHIDYDKENLDPRNLLSFCSACHRKTNTNRRQWTRYFRNMMRKVASA